MSRAPIRFQGLRQIGDPLTLALELFIPSVSLLLAVDHLFVVLPGLYSLTGVGLSKLGLRVALALSAAIGWLFARRVGNTLALLLGSLGVACSGSVDFLAFSRGATASFCATLPSLLGMLVVGAAARKLPQNIRVRWTRDEISRVLLQPFIALGFAVGLCCAAVFENAIGPIRAGLAIAGGLAAAATLVTPLPTRRWTPGSTPEQRGGWEPQAVPIEHRFARKAGVSLLVLYAIGAVIVERRLPLHLLLTSSHPLVYYAQSDRCTFSVTSGQGAYHVFVNGELRFSTFDEKRWAEALVMPALSRVSSPKRALVLSTGEGLIERELLRDPALGTITSVARCRLIADTSRQSGWFRRLTNDALNSPRVSLVERDPAVYLINSDRQRYDLVIVDLPDPSDPKESKYYTRYFYQLIAEQLSDQGVLIVQATSARRSPRTFATIGATLEAAGFALQPIIVPLVSRGEWSLYLAAKVQIPSPIRPEWIQSGLVATTPQQFYQPWPDTRAPKDFLPRPSTLHNGLVREWFARESDPESLPATASSSTVFEDDWNG